MTDKRLLLIIGGGIAAYKSLELIRRLRETSVSLEVVLTDAGARFITPLSVSALAGTPVHTDLFDVDRESDMRHISLTRNADMVLVAPCTADLAARMALGQADDLATTLLLASTVPVAIAPSMNVRMWTHAATRRNMARLHEDGIAVIGPDEGDMACGEYGFGRMAEVSRIVAYVEDFFAQREAGVSDGGDGGMCSGYKILITAGPTYEPIDTVRYMTNRSSGKQGYALAHAAVELGGEVILISGPTALDPPPNSDVRYVETAHEMAEAVKAVLPVDMGIFTAAVSDWRVVDGDNHRGKLKKGRGVPELVLEETEDILAHVSQNLARRPKLVIGFAAETDDIAAHACAKRDAKGCDWIVANDVSDAGGGIMGGDMNHIMLITEEGVEQWTKLTKRETARRLMRRAAQRMREMAR